MSYMNNYAWLTTKYGALLHYMENAGETPELFDRAVDEGAVTETAICGRSANYIAPGFLTRIGENRCLRCCEALGIPEGIGTPHNSVAMRRGGFETEAEEA